MESKLFKRLFSMCIVIALVLSMCPTVVFADGTSDDPFVAPDPTTVACPCSSCKGAVPTWSAWTGKERNGHYYMTADYVSPLGGIVIGTDQHLILNLNGWDIDFSTRGTTNNYANQNRFYLNKATSALDIMDSTAHEYKDEYISGEITNGYALINTSSSSSTYNRGGNFYINGDGAYVNLHSGAITNGQAMRGGNVYVSSGAFNMYGGVVKGGSGTSEYGSELMCAGSSAYINIYGGTISGSRAYPAVQSMYSQINMYGGLIKYTGSDAAVRLNNTSANYNPVTNIYGGEIQGKLSTSDSKGVTTLNIYGGTFSSISIDADTITHFYNGVFSSSNPTAYKADCACVYKNEAGRYILWPAGHIEGTCSADCAYATAKASYGSYITEQVGEHTLTTNDASSTGYACASCASEMAAPTNIHTEEFYCQKCQDTKNFMPWDGVATNGHYYVEESFTQETVVAVANGEQLCLDLNGKEITGASAKRALYVYAGGVLSVQDSSEAKSGKVTGSGTPYAGDGGLMAAGGELNLYGGTFSGGKTNTSSQYGGNLYVSGTALITGDAKILGGVSGGHGGNIYITSGGKVTISGNAEIGNGEAAAQGGNIYVTGGASRLYIRGGVIHSGVSGYAGGNVGINSGAHAYMYAGTVRDGITKDTSTGNFGGGNIWVFNAASGSQSTFAMYGGTISGGSSMISGNVICARGDGAAFIYGGTIEDQAANAASGTALREFSCDSDRGIIFYNVKVKLDPKSYMASCADYCYADGYYKVWHTGEDHVDEMALVAAADVNAPMTHVYSDATCTTAPTCACGQTSGEALGHAYPETWTDGEKVCANGCGEKITCEHAEFTLTGAVDADCTKPGYTGDKVCNECGMTFETGSEIEQKAHEYGEDGKCTNGCENDKCTNEGHDYTGENGVCVNGCEKTKCENEGHKFEGENGLCVNGCNKTYCDYNGHDFNAETGLCNNGCGTTACSGGHNPGEAKQEDLVEATCQAPGSYNLVIRCTRCDEVISSEEKTIEQKPHDYSGENGACVNGCNKTQCQNDGCNPGEAAWEDVVNATCQAPGSYNLVVRCTRCNEIQSTEAKVIDQLSHDYSGENGVCVNGCGKTYCDYNGHTDGEAQQEDLINATCQAPGSYNLVVRCTVCNEIQSTEAHTIEQLPHEYDLETGICGNGCNVQATVKVTHTDGSVAFYTDGNAALVAENNSGATLYFLKTTTVKFTTNFKESSLKNVTLATAPGVTLKDNSGTSSGTYYLSNVTLAKDSKFEFNGYPKLTGACHFYGYVDLYMIAVDKNLTVHGDEGAYLRVERNIWIGATMTVIGNDPNTVVFEANYHSGDYNIYADGGVLNVQNAKITCDKFVWNQSADNPPATVANLTNATIQTGIFSVGKNQSVNMKGNSSIVVSGETSFFSDGYVTMEAGCTFTTAAEGQQNAGIIAAEGVDGCIYYADGVYTVAEHTYPETWTDGQKACTNCGNTLDCEHVPGEEKIENNVDPDCENAGSYDTVTYCTICGKETSRVTTPVDALGHTNGAPVTENEKAPDCVNPGSYDTVVYCTVCGEELSRVTTPVDALGHTYTYTSNNDKKTHTIGCEKGDYNEVADCADADGDKFCDLCEQKLIDPKFTVDGVEVETLDEALALAVSGSTIKLLDNVVLTERLTLDKRLTFDLNDYSITGAFEDAFGMIYVKKGATVTFMGGLVENTADVAIAVYGYVIVATDATVNGYGAGIYNMYYTGDYYGGSRINGQVNAIWNSGELVISEYGVAEYLDNSGYATIYGTVNEIYAQDGTDAPDVYNGNMLIISDVANVGAVNVGEDYKLVEVEPYVYKVVAKVYVAEANGQKYESFEEAFAQGGEIKLLADIELESAETKLFTIGEDDKITLNLNGKKITCTDKSTRGFYVFYNLGELTITGDGEISITAENDRMANVSAVIGNYGKLTIEGGKLTHNGGSYMSFAVESNSIRGNVSMTVKGGELYSAYQAIYQALMRENTNDLLIEGGKVTTGQYTAVHVRNNDRYANAGSITITGGEVGTVAIYFPNGDSANFDVCINANCVAGVEAYLVNEAVGNVNGIYTKVPAVAKNGDDYYASLEAAIEDAYKGNTITLLADITLTERLTIASDLTIDLNGFSITGDFTDAFGLFYVKKGATLTVKNGLIENTADVAIGNYGKVIIEASATVKGEGAGLYNMYYQADYYGEAVVNGTVNAIWNSGKLTINATAQVAYLDNSGYTEATGYIAELYLGSGEDAPAVPNAGLVKGDIAGKFELAGGTFETSKYVMIGATEGKYISTDAIFTIAPDATMDMTIVSGTITLNETLWYTMEGQTLTIAEEATFVIPAGKTLYVNGSKVVVNGTAANFGTLILANGAHLKGDVAGTFQMAGGTFETSKYVMIGATQGKYLTTDAIFTIAPNATMDMTVVSGTITLNDADWWTLAGQTLTIAKDAKFVVPAGKNINVQGTVIVEGTAVTEGTVTLYNENATVKAAAGLNVVAKTGICVVYIDGVYSVHTAHNYAEVTYTDPTIEADGFWTYKCHCGDSYTVIDENTRLHVNVPTVDAEDIKDNIETEDTEATTEEIQDVIDHVVHGNDAVVDKDIFVDDANNAVIEQMKNENPALADKEPVLHITLQGMSIKTENGELVANKLVFDVTPMLGDQKIENLAAPLTFHLPVDDSLSGYAYVFHEGEFMGVYAIVSEGGHNYVIVSSQNFSAFTVEVQNANDVAVNMTTGETYESVQAAISAAAKGETVKLVADVNAQSVYIGAGKTLDLNGYKLTVTDFISASYTTSHIVDSSNGTGLLVVDGADVALNSQNNQLPIWTAEGVRFVAVKIDRALDFKDATGAANENVAYYRFAFSAEQALLDQILANGSDGTGLAIRIKVSYTTENGMKAYQYFEYTNELVQKYYNHHSGWQNAAFRLYLSGVAGVADLTFTAEVVSTAPNGTSVVIGSAPIA